MHMFQAANKYIALCVEVDKKACGILSLQVAQVFHIVRSYVLQVLSENAGMTLRIVIVVLEDIGAVLISCGLAKK